MQRSLVTTQGAGNLPLPVQAEKSNRILPGGWTTVAVCGAHLSGLPLNHQLTERGAYLLEKTQSSANYRFYALPGGPPYRPGMVRTDADTDSGAEIEMEIWAISLQQFGSFVAGIPGPLGIGQVETASGEWVQGFICESYAVKEAEDITKLGSWRTYLATKNI